MTKEEIQEYTLRITRANRSEIIVIVYELALKYIDTSIEAYNNGDYDLFRDNARYAGKCVGDLLEALDFDYEAAFPLMRLYVFINKQISLAPIKKDIEPLNISKRLLEKLKLSFDEIAKQDTSGPLMSNTQEVYAGLTYGRTSLNENIGGSSNRGFTV